MPAGPERRAGTSPAPDPRPSRSVRSGPTCARAARIPRAGILRRARGTRPLLRAGPAKASGHRARASRRERAPLRPWIDSHLVTRAILRKVPGMELEGRNVVITGASRGLGRQIAGALAAEKANLVLAARSAAELEETAKAISGVQVKVVKTDVTRRADLEKLAAAAGE